MAGFYHYHYHYHYYLTLGLIVLDRLYVTLLTLYILHIPLIRGLAAARCKDGNIDESNQ
jgi:hypothetical protein